MEAFGLAGWSVTFLWDVAGGSAAAQVEPLPHYKFATFRFPLQKMKGWDKAEVLRIIRHEVLHVVLSSYALYARQLTDKRGRKVLFNLEETLITNLEDTPAMRGI